MDVIAIEIGYCESASVGRIVMELLSSAREKVQY
jgi:hypothetical protein